LELGASIKLPRLRYEEFDEESFKVLVYGNGQILFRASWKGKDVVVRQNFCLNLRTVDEDPYIRAWFKEVANFQLQYEGLIECHGIIEEYPYYSVVTPYFPKGSLYDILVKRKEELKWKELAQIALKISETMEFLHAKGVAHGAIGLRNIYLDAGNRPKLEFGSDLQLLLKVNNKLYGKQKSLVGPVSWLAPEVLDKGTFSLKSDSFSFGVFLWELWVKADPFSERSTIEVACPVIHKNLRLSIPESTPEAVKALMQLCWEAEPGKRPAFDQITKDLKGYVGTL